MEFVEGTTARQSRARGGTPRRVGAHRGRAAHRALGRARARPRARSCDEEGTPARSRPPRRLAGQHSHQPHGRREARRFRHRARGRVRPPHRSGQLKGKLGYMSPEQVTGRELDAKSDQFTAAIVLAELLMARPLFSGRARDGRAGEDPRRRYLDARAKRVAHAGRFRRRSSSARWLGAAKQRFPTTSAYAEALEEVIQRRGLPARPATLVEWLHAGGARQGPGNRASTRLTLRVLAEAAPPAKHSGAQLVASLHHPTLESLPPTQAAPAVYRVLLPHVPGALSLSDITELFASGRVFGDTPVARNNGPFKPAREFDELSCLCGGPKAQGSEASRRISQVVGAPAGRRSAGALVRARCAAGHRYSWCVMGHAKRRCSSSTGCPK